MVQNTTKALIKSRKIRIIQIRNKTIHTGIFTLHGQIRLDTDIINILRRRRKLITQRRIITKINDPSFILMSKRRTRNNRDLIIIISQCSKIIKALTDIKALIYTSRRNIRSLISKSHKINITAPRSLNLTSVSSRTGFTQQASLTMATRHGYSRGGVFIVNHRWVLAT